MNRSSRGWVVVGFLSLFAVAGCGGGSGQPVDLDELFNRVYVAVCKYEVACEQLPDMATCMSTLQQQPGYLATIKQDIVSGKVSYDRAKAGACIDLLERLYDDTCLRSALATVSDAESDSCDDVFMGTVAPGGACFFSEQCVGGGACQTTDPNCLRSRQCCPGTCAAKPPDIPVGGDCSAPMSGQTCASGSYCNTALSGASLTCVVPSKIEGTPCTAATLCAAPLFCDLDSATGMGTCRHVVASGAPCNPDVGSSSCDDGRDYCDPTTALCTRKLSVGATCVVQQYNCVGTAQCVGTTCVARSGPGGACGSTNGPGCLGSLQCDTTTSTCVLSPIGGACM